MGFVKEVKLSPFANDIIRYRKKPWRFHQQIIINKFSKLEVYTVYRNLLFFSAQITNYQRN